jgi:pimeloyl-ACP methyl ester carboxylesterase
MVSYDRRGHSQSEPTAGEGRMSEDVADLAALINCLQFYKLHLKLTFLDLRPDTGSTPPIFRLIQQKTTKSGGFQAPPRRFEHRTPCSASKCSIH